MNENEDRPANERDDIATLVRLAGKRQAVPRERAERVRSAARAQWQSEVQRRRSSRRVAWSAAALAVAASLVVALAWWMLDFEGVAPTGSGERIVVESLDGGAWTRVADGGQTASRQALGIGDGIPLGSELEIAPEGRAALRLPSGHSVRLDRGTAIRWLREDALALDRGAVYVDSGPDSADERSIEVRTPLGVVREIGTQFEVRLEDESVRVRLREGEVVLLHDAQRHGVREGTELIVGLDGSVTRRAIPAHGPEWQWIVGVTPLLDLEGRTARVFLDWVARERGWTLAFADERVARASDEIVLGGTGRRLTLDEALDAVLPTCRMTYRVESGILVISALPD